MAVIFADDPAPSKNLPSQDLNLFFLVFFIIPPLHVIALTMKTIFTIPILQRAVYSKTQIKRKRSQFPIS